MNVYQLLRDLANSGNRNEQWLKEANEFIDNAELVNLFGTVGAQELAEHAHNFQWDYRTYRRTCTVCGKYDVDQTKPGGITKRYW